MSPKKIAAEANQAADKSTGPAPTPDSTAIPRDSIVLGSMSITPAVKPYLEFLASQWSMVVKEFNNAAEAQERAQKAAQRAQDLEESLAEMIRGFVTRCASSSTSLDDLDLSVNHTVLLNTKDAAMLPQLLQEPHTSDDIASSIRNLVRPATEAGTLSTVIKLPKYRKRTVEDRIAELEHHNEALEHKKDSEAYETKVFEAGGTNAMLELADRLKEYKAQVAELERKEAKRQRSD